MVTINPLWLVITIVATWRITNIITEEKIAEPLRKVFGDDGVSYPDTMIAYLFHCFYCMSVWVGLICTLLMLFFPFILLPFAISGTSIFLKEFINKRTYG